MQYLPVSESGDEALAWVRSELRFERLLADLRDGHDGGRAREERRRTDPAAA